MGRQHLEACRSWRRGKKKTKPPSLARDELFRGGVYSCFRALQMGRQHVPPFLRWELFCQQVKPPIGRRLLIVQTTHGDSLWVKDISEPRVRDTVFRFVVTLVSCRVTLSNWWVMVTIGHDVLILARGVFACGGVVSFENYH